MTDKPLTSRELSALAAAVAIAFDGHLPSRRQSERELIESDAKAAPVKLQASAPNAN